jgi:hypothetical protein
VSLRPPGAAPADPLLHGILAAAESAEEGTPELLSSAMGSRMPKEPVHKKCGSKRAITSRVVLVVLDQRDGSGLPRPSTPPFSTGCHPEGWLILERRAGMFTVRYADTGVPMPGMARGRYLHMR